VLLNLPGLGRSHKVRTGRGLSGAASAASASQALSDAGARQQAGLAGGSGRRACARPHAPAAPSSSSEGECRRMLPVRACHACMHCVIGWCRAHGRETHARTRMRTPPPHACVQRHVARATTEEKKREGSTAEGKQKGEAGGGTTDTDSGDDAQQILAVRACFPARVRRLRVGGMPACACWGGNSGSSNSGTTNSNSCHRPAYELKPEAETTTGTGPASQVRGHGEQAPDRAVHGRGHPGCGLDQQGPRGGEPCPSGEWRAGAAAVCVRGMLCRAVRATKQPARHLHQHS